MNLEPAVLKQQMILQRKRGVQIRVNITGGMYFGRRYLSLFWLDSHLMRPVTLFIDAMVMSAALLLR